MSPPLDPWPPRSRQSSSAGSKRPSLSRAHATSASLGTIPNDAAAHSNPSTSKSRSPQAAFNEVAELLLELPKNRPRSIPYISTNEAAATSSASSLLIAPDATPKMSNSKSCGDIRRTALSKGQTSIRPLESARVRTLLAASPDAGTSSSDDVRPRASAWRSSHRRSLGAASPTCTRNRSPHVQDGRIGTQAASEASRSVLPRRERWHRYGTHEKRKGPEGPFRSSGGRI
jgi:hypothetical protein